MAGPIGKIWSQHLVVMHKLLEEHSIGGQSGFPRSGVWRPPTDVFECSEAYVVRLAISGLRRNAAGEVEDAEVTIENDLLTIRGNRRERCDHERWKFLQMEIHYGPFECRVRLNAPFDRDGIRALYRDGFLDVIIPKASRQPDPIKVSSRAGSDGGGAQ